MEWRRSGTTSPAIACGAPNTVTTKTYSNAFGAQWVCGEAYWLRTNGVIDAKETIEVPNRVVTIVFFNLDQLAKQAATNAAKPSPY